MSPHKSGPKLLIPEKMIPAEVSTCSMGTQMQKVDVVKIWTLRIPLTLVNGISEHSIHKVVHTQSQWNYRACQWLGASNIEQVPYKSHRATFGDVNKRKWINVIKLGEVGGLSKRKWKNKLCWHHRLILSKFEQVKGYVWKIGVLQYDWDWKSWNE